MNGRDDHVALVCPRFADGSLVGGAETLLANLARRAARAGRRVTFLTTCAVNHFTWANERPAGAFETDGLTVRAFPVDADRDIETFLAVQNRISHGARVPPAEEQQWLRNNVNSRALIEHLQTRGGEYDAIVMGPYLFGLVYFAAQVHPARTLLVPCLHDEAFARLEAFRDLFHRVRGFLFNTEPERDLARRLYQLDDAGGDRQLQAVVGMGLDPFEADPHAFAAARGLDRPYLLYAGRREPLKGTPLLLDYLAAFRARTGIDLALALVGSGEVDIPPDLAPHVIDAGFVSEQEKHAAMAGALAFCHPSVNESLSIVLLEAWLAGAPALVHGACEVLRWQCRRANGGLWFRTYPEFEAGLRLLTEQPALRRAMAEAGRAYVRRHYAWEAVEERLLKALDAAAPPR